MLQNAPTPHDSPSHAHHARSFDELPQFGRSAMANLWLLNRDFLPFMSRVHAECGDLARVSVLFHELVVASHPRHVKQVLVAGKDVYGKGTRGYDVLREVLGNGLVTSEGSFWMRQRRIALPAFHSSRLASMGDRMVVATEDLIDEWAPLSASGGRVDISKALMCLTLRIIGETMLSVDPTDAASEIGEAVEEVLRFVTRRTLRLGPPTWVPTPVNLSFQRALSLLDDVVVGIIEGRRLQERDYGDLLSMFMAIQDEETGERMNDRQLRDEVMTMFLAGHETTATALTWAVHLLAENPGWRQELERELDTVLGGRRATFADLKRLPLLDRVLKETMRLCPPVPVIARRANQAASIDGVAIPAGAYMLISPYLVHRHPEIWSSPLRFDPDRFLPERMSGIPRLAYIPFSAGQRMCIGNRFAMMEAALVLATLMQRLRIEQVPGHPVIMDAKVTLRARHGLMCSLHRRDTGQ